MAHESFEDDAIAGLMNELFVNIKVDREERPDIDAIYQSALALTGQHGGWPLTMFLTPDGEPFWGGTYFPPEQRYGRPGFPDILRRVAEVYHTDPEAIAKNKAALVDALNKLGQPTDDASPVQVTEGILNQVATRIASEVDQVHGGIGSAPKFPQPYAFDYLWRSWLRTGDDSLRAATEKSLTAMCQGGIYDHLGGGFARYSTDDQWLAPHFEKMLYDNAQLLSVLVHLWQATRRPLYEARIRETIDWILREMLAPAGGFAATLDADSEGVEGKFYVWSEAEVDALLGADAGLFKSHYDVSAAGNWEAANILNRTARPVLADAETEAALARCRQVLLDARAGRIRPGWDDKVLADWNGMMIAALVDAANALDEPAWHDAASAAFDFVVAKLGDGDRLLHAHRNGDSQHKGMLEDYAAMGRAALKLYESTGEDRYLDHARRWTDSVERFFRDHIHGGYFQTASDAEHLIARMRNCADNAVPAGNGVMVEVLTRLWLLTGDDQYRASADALITAFSSDLMRNFFPMTTFLAGAELMIRPLQVIIIGRREDAAAQAMLRTLHTTCLPLLVLQVVDTPNAIPAGHPAYGKQAMGDGPTAYVCEGVTCSLPVSTAEALAALLPDPPAFED